MALTKKSFACAHAMLIFWVHVARVNGYPTRKLTPLDVTVFEQPFCRRRVVVFLDLLAVLHGCGWSTVRFTQAYTLLVGSGSYPPYTGVRVFVAIPRIRVKIGVLDAFACPVIGQAGVCFALHDRT